MKPRHPIAGLDHRPTQTTDHRMDLLTLAVGLTAAALLIISALVTRV